VIREGKVYDVQQAIQTMGYFVNALHGVQLTEDDVKALDEYYTQKKTAEDPRALKNDLKIIKT
jgi:hypothetical protein